MSPSHKVLSLPKTTIRSGRAPRRDESNESGPRDLVSVSGTGKPAPEMTPEFSGSAKQAPEATPDVSGAGKPAAEAAPEVTLLAVSNPTGLALEAEACGESIGVPSKARGFVRHVQGGLLASLSTLLNVDPEAVKRLGVLSRAVRTPADDTTSSALALVGSAARGRVFKFPGDVDYCETVLLDCPPQDGDRRMAEKLVATIRQAERQGLILAAIQVEDTKFLADGGGLSRRRGFDGEPERVDDLVDGLTHELSSAPIHDFLKLDFLGLVDGNYREPTKNLRFATRDPQSGELQFRFSEGNNDLDYEFLYATEEEAQLSNRLSPHSHDPVAFYLQAMNREIAHHAGRDSMKVAKRLYARYCAEGDWGRAGRLGSLFCRGEAGATQVRTELVTLRRALERSLPLERDKVAAQLEGMQERLADANPELAVELEPSLEALRQHYLEGEPIFLKQMAGLESRIGAWVEGRVRNFLESDPHVQLDLQLAQGG